jgi:toxin ParE1/3/4
MAKFELTNKDVADLNGIWEYTLENWSEKQTDKYYATIKLSCNRIVQNPDVGKEYDGINKNLLVLKSGKHIIFYQSLSEDKIVVIRILHERMDLKKRITE